jgi:hypothetical protein
MKLIAALLTLGLVCSGASIVTSTPRLQIDGNKLSTLQTRANVPTQEYTDWVALTCAGKPYNALASTAYAESFALLYLLDKQPCSGGTRASYATLAMQYARNTLIINAFAQSPRTVTSITNSTTPTVTFDSPHGLTIGVQVSNKAIAGGMGGWAMLNNRIRFTPTTTTAGTITCDTGGITPCSVDTTSSGSFTGQHLTFFSSHSSLIAQNQMRWYGRILARTFEWAGPGISSPDFNYYDVRNAMMYFAKYVANDVNNQGCSTLAGYGSNLCTGSVSAALYAAIALGNQWVESGTWTQGSTTAYPDAQDVFNDLRDHYVSVGIPFLLSTGQFGGAFHEGPEYAPQTRGAHIEIAEAILTGTGEDLFTSLQPWMQLAVQFVIHSTSPKQHFGTNEYEALPFSDIGTSLVNETSADEYEAMQHLAEHVSAPYDEYAQYWILNRDPLDKMSAFQKFTRTLQTSTNFSALATDFDEGGIGFVIGRSSWTNPAATWVWIENGWNFGSHIHAERGAYGLYRNGRWLMKHRQGYPNASTDGYVHDGFHPLPHYIRNQRNATGGSAPANSGGRVTKSRYKSTTDYLHTQLDIKPAYLYTGFGSLNGVSNSQITNAYRDFFWLKNDVLVINDRVNYNSTQHSAFSQIWETAPTVASNKVSYSVSGQSVDMTVISPTSPTILSTALSARTMMLVKKTNPTEICWDVSVSNTLFPSTITLSGGTGDWAVLNATHTVTTFATNTGKTESCGTIPIDSTGFTDPADQNIVQDSVTRTGTGGYYKTYYRTPGGTNHSSMQVYVMRDTAAPEISPVAVTMNSGTFAGFKLNQQIVVMPSTTGTLTLPDYSYTASGTVKHFITGLAVSTAYNCNTATPGRVIVSAGAGCTSNDAGILEITTNEGGTPTITLNVSPATLTFNGQEAGSNPPNQTITFTSSGGALDQYTASDNQTYCSVSPTSGTVAADITVSVNITGLTVGTHTCTVTISSTTAGVSNSPRTVAVDVVIAAGTSLSASPTSLAFAGEVGQPNPPSQNVVISATNPVSISLTDNGSWLTCTPTSGTTPVTVSCTATTGALSNGTYNADITVTASGVTNSPFTIPVEFVLTTPATTLFTDVPALAFTYTLGGTVPADQTFTVTATPIDTDITPVLTDSNGIFSVTPIAGTTPQVFTVSANVTGVFPGTYTAFITIHQINGVSVQENLSLVVSAGGALTVTTRPISTMVLFTYGVAGLDANQTCTIRILDTSNLELARTTDTGGRARRRYLWTSPALTPDTASYTAQVMCGTYAAEVSFDTPAAESVGTTTFPIFLYAPQGRSVAEVYLEYDSSSALSFNTTVACTTTCTVTLSPSKGTFLHFRYTWRTAAHADVGPASEIHRVAIE